ncbi:PRMT5-domain-containing protein, partial [Suhomyces tanzawaensis NRRL Y-17324]
HPYQNLLIDPLQPLRDDLTVGVYDQFEKDENKYHQYDQAIELALEDLSHHYENVRVLVVGPGKGKLVDKLFKNSCKMTVLLVEKNPHCMTILEQKNRTVWSNSAQIVLGDIRNYQTDFKPHLVISELLGSFGDNELCPEILAPFNREPKPRIMIPSSYTSYLQPIFSPLLNDVDLRPYLCSLTRYIKLANSQKVWEFEHPSDDSFSITKTINFTSSMTHSLNCFLGYFRSNLYGHLNITILPDDGDGDEFCSSWFPILFPVHSSVIQQGQSIELKVTRVTTTTRVWYTWKFQEVEYNKEGQYCMEL